MKISFLHLSIKRKINLIMMFISAVALLLTGAGMMVNDLTHQRQVMTEDLVTLAKLVGANVSAPLAFGDQAAATETLSFLANQEQVLSGVIYTTNGRAFATYVRSDLPEGTSPPRARGESVPLWGDHFDVFQKIIIDGEHIGSTYLRSDMAKMGQRMDWYITILSTVLVVSLVIVYLLSSSLQRVISDPILRLSDTVKKISKHKNYSLRVDVIKSRDEIGQLIKGFNDMVSTIQARDSELAQQHLDLEQTIELRTSDLQEAYKQLEASKERAESAAKRMTYQAYHDALTDLPNRAMLNDRLTMELAHASREQKQVAILFLDLDRFKIINDSLGHAYGDQVLRAVAQRLENCIRDDDTVARLGGDEFMVLLPNIAQAEDAGRVASKIIDSICKPIVFEDQELNVTTSIGIAIYPEDGTNPVTLVKNADTSMYRAKEKGRNNYAFYTSGMDMSMVNRLNIEQSMRRAIDNQEFRLVYQPKVSSETHCVVGAEALLRWNDPELGEISPTDFIKVAEETGLIVPLGEWVLKTACEDIQRWQSMGLPDFRTAVNISARQLDRDYLIPLVEQTLSSTGISPGLLELEITESLAMDDAENTTRTLKQLNAMGIHTSIDDFGTGYSSLSYLTRFKIDSLKIDLSFIKDIPHNQDDAALAAAIISLAHKLGMSVVAEGVETRAQLDFLASEDCDSIQGRLFCGALETEEFEALLTSTGSTAIKLSDAV